MPMTPNTLFDGRPSGQEQEYKDSNFNLWSSIQASKDTVGSQSSTPYVHPLVRRSSTSLSRRSLEICTETLGSETGSDGFSDMDEDLSSSSSPREIGELRELIDNEVEEPQEEADEEVAGKEYLASVNYHCSVGRRSTLRSFPPPLPSISRHDGPCVQMRPYRRDGRLVVEAVPVPSQNYLHCQRRGGRLVLKFVDTTFEEIYPEIEASPVSPEQNQEQEVTDEKQDEEGVDADEEEEESVEGEEEKTTEEEEERGEEEQMEDEEGEEEGEVGDRTIVVEVKVGKCRIAINKFASGMPLLDGKVEGKWPEQDTSAATVIVMAYNGRNGTALKSGREEAAYGWGNRRQEKHHSHHHYQQQRHCSQDIRLCRLTSKKPMKARRCSYHQHRLLFIWDGCCIVTTAGQHHTNPLQRLLC